HLLHKRHVPHVVPEVQPRPGGGGGGEDAVAPGDRDRHGLFEVDGDASLQRRDRLLFVQVVGRGDEDGVELRLVEQLAVVGKGAGLGVPAGELGQGGRVHVGAGDDLAAPAGAVGVVGEPAATADADYTNAQILRAGLTDIDMR